MNTVRAFFAVPLPETLQDLVQKTIEPYAGLPFKWVKPENWHLTITFLGEVPKEAILALCEPMATLLAKQQPFVVCTSSIDYFPSRRKARVLAILFENCAALQALAQNMVALCKEQGLAPDEKPFYPHVTLARFKLKKAPDLDIPAFQAPLCVRQVILFQSTLTAEGAQHEPMRVFNLCLQNES